MEVPDKIIIYSDGNELRFHGEQFQVETKDKKLMYTYIYTKSKTKKGMLLSMDENNLIKLLETQKIFEK